MSEMVDKGNTKAPTMHWRWGSATLLLLAFLKKSNPNFTWEEFQWDNTVVNFSQITISTYIRFVSCRHWKGSVIKSHGL